MPLLTPTKSLLFPSIFLLFVVELSNCAVSGDKPARKPIGNLIKSGNDVIQVLKTRDGKMNGVGFPPLASSSSGSLGMMTLRGFGGGGGTNPGAPYTINCYYCNIFLGGGGGGQGGGGGSGGPSWDGDDVTGKAIAIHNRLRAKHRAGPLTSNATLIAGAQNWANARLSGSSGHSGTPGVGENIAWQATSGTYTVDEVVNMGVQDWYDEISNYDFNRPGDDSRGTIGHFTQLVWKASEQIGCAMSSGPYTGSWSGNQYYLVCQYYPQGNYYYTGMKAQAYRANVLPASSRKASPGKYNIPNDPEF